MLALPLTSTDYEQRDPDGYVYNYPVQHPEDVWWLLAPNPFVVLADAAPRVSPRYVQRDGDQLRVDENDPLSSLANEVRRLRRPTVPYASDQIVTAEMEAAQRADPGPIWPWGLGFDVLVGVGAVAVAARRLRTPSRKLGRGVRIA